MSRPGLYFLVLLTLLNSCGADENSREALRLIEKHIAGETR